MASSTAPTQASWVSLFPIGQRCCPGTEASSPGAPDLCARHGAGTPRHAICEHVIGTLRDAGRRRSLPSTSIGYEEPVAGCTHTRVPDRRVGCAHGFLGTTGSQRRCPGRVSTSRRPVVRHCLLARTFRTATSSCGWTPESFAAVGRATSYLHLTLRCFICGVRRVDRAPPASLTSTSAPGATVATCRELDRSDQFQRPELPDRRARAAGHRHEHGVGRSASGAGGVQAADHRDHWSL
jgi:hypothetical protein